MLKKTLIITTILIISVVSGFYLIIKCDINPYEYIYYSSLRKKFNKEQDKLNIKFIPVDTAIVKKIPFDYITIIGGIKNSNIIRHDSYVKTLERDLNITDTATEKYKNKGSVITIGRFKNKIAILYTDYQFESLWLNEPGYWLALSLDNGINYKTYYTGLTQMFYYDFRRDFQIDNYKNDSTFQVSANIVRLIDQGAYPGLPPQYENVDSNLVVQFDLKKLTKDSDNDNLTDITELKMNLNPYSKDTDGDGILDDIDSNPRFKSVIGEKTTAIEAIVEGNLPLSTYWKDNSCIITTANQYRINYSKTKKINETYLIVTDNKDIQTISLADKRLIILSNKEYLKYSGRFPSCIDRYFINIFKCNFWNNAYIIETSNKISSDVYVIKRISDGWKIILIGGSIM